MKAALLAPLALGLSLAISPLAQAQSYDSQGNSINIPLPKFLGNGNNNREQQAQLPNRGSASSCDRLRRNDDELRYDADHAEYAQDRDRAERQLRSLDDQIARECD